MQQAAAGQCRGCHTEHLGRDADINKLSQAGFAHDLTNFPLEGTHVALACGSCHKSATPYRKAPSTCIECHRKDDIHRGALGTDCASCHAAQSWQQTRFDHDETKFPLTNRHRDVPCAACHAGQRYQGTPLQCVGMSLAGRRAQGKPGDSVCQLPHDG